MDNGGRNGWNEYSRLVLSELKRLNDAIERVEEKQGKIQTEIAMLKVKAGLWGALFGSIPAAIGIAWMLLTK